MNEIPSTSSACTPPTIDDLLMESSYSSSKTFHSCPRKYFYERHGVGKTLPRDESLAASVGQAMHEAIQHYFISGYNVDAALWALIWFYPHALSAAEPDKRTLLDCTAALLNLLNSGVLRQYELVYFNGKPAVELAFRLLHPSGLHHRGKLDLVVWHAVNQTYSILDIKTRAAYGEPDLAQYQFSDQCVPYRFAVEHIVGRRDVRFDTKYVVINLMLTRPDFWVFPVEPAPDAFDQWMLRTQLQAALIKQFRASGHWPRNGEACFSWNRRCRYFDICRIPLEALDRMYEPVNDTKPAFEEDFVIDLRTTSAFVP